MKTGKADRAVVPLTGVIDSSIESAFARIKARLREDVSLEAREILLNMLVACGRADRRRRAYALVASPEGQDALRRACARLTDVELDTAWRAAMRGDRASVDARVLPHVDVRAPKRTPKGSPWRVWQGERKRSSRRVRAR